MQKKYSDIKEKLQIEVERENENQLAHLTHYFHNHKNGVSQHFRENAKYCLESLHE